MSANGYLTDAELAPIDNGQRLAPAAASRYLAMLAKAASEGVTIRTTEGYRDYDRQVYYRNLWLAGKGNPAGIPGTSSHGWGLAVDLNTVGFGGTVFNWLTANAAAFGFNNRQGRADREHWHWVYDGTGTAGLDTKPFPTEKDKHMRIVSAPWLPPQPAPFGDYKTGDDKNVKGGRYLLVNEVSGRSAQIVGTQNQIERLGAFINESSTNTDSQATVSWILTQLAAVAPVGGTSGPVTVNGPSADEIAAKVIEYQKKPGN